MTILKNIRSAMKQRLIGRVVPLRSTFHRVLTEPEQRRNEEKERRQQENENYSYSIDSIEEEEEKKTQERPCAINYPV